MLPKPEIIVSSEDYNQLYALLDTLPDSKTTDLLVDELERAKVVSAEQLPENVVSMYSQVTFTVLSTGKTFTCRLVYPHQAHERDALSILKPVGSAILGLSIGDVIEWPLENNRQTLVRIDRVVAC